MDWRIGVIGRREGATAGAPPTVRAVAAFAAAVWARHAPRTLYADHLDMALARPEAAHVSHVHAGPRIGLTAELTFNHHAPLQGSAQAAATSRRQGGGFGEAQARAVFERLFSRHARISALDEHRATPLPDIPAKAPATLAAAPGRTERVLPRRSAPPIAAASTGPGPGTEKATVAAEWGVPFSATAPPKQVVLAPPEIRRVADQVIREIDHRISAQRERLGGR
jgi:hypothetical protein